MNTDDPKAVEVIKVDDSITNKRPEFIERPYDPQPEREKRRGQLAMTLVWTLIVMVMASFLGVALKVFSITDMKDLAPLLITPFIGLVGAAIGFYFGSSK